MIRCRGALTGLTALALVAACSGSDDSGAADQPSASTPTTESSTERATRQIVEQPDWGDVFDEAGATGTFVLREVGDDATDDATLVWNVDRAAEPRLPASTFKVLNSMIILETGAIADVDTMVPWDGVTREVEVWNRDHSLRTGIEVSAVWMYQALAREVGAAEMAEWVAAADYGNGLTGERVDEFWLRGDLRISPLEQADFLERMSTGQLPFRPEVVDAVEEILIREQGAGWSWSHKTGTALAEEPVLGWLVGTSTVGERTWVFAMNIDLTDVGELDRQIDPQARQRIARTILESAGALPSAT